MYNIIFATDQNGIYDPQEELYSRDDREYFKEVTTQGDKNCVIMGRKTWESLSIKPLPKRMNIVLSTHLSIEDENVKVFKTLEQAFRFYQKEKYDNVFVIGGGKVWKECMDKYAFLLNEVHHTIFHYRNKSQGQIFTINDYSFLIRHRTYYYSSITIGVYENKYEVQTSEQQYLSLLKNVLDNGERRSDRTGVGVISVFTSVPIRYDLMNGKVPIFTTKKVVWDKGIQELLWYISGGTSSKQLEKVGVNYWKGNSTREFLDAQGLTEYEEGELGPIYGAQWRRWGAEYKNEQSEGIDQLKWIINEIKTNPTSRRLILSAWNVSDLNKMALPPCHMFCQFYVSKNKYLHSTLYQRSGDLFLGVPLNVLCYSLLTHIIAQVCDLETGSFTHVIGDAHIYTNHIDAVNKQLSRKVYPFPKVSFLRHISDIDDVQFEDFIISDYWSHSPIKAPMAI
jgi:thymidylate synthase